MDLLIPVILSVHVSQRGLIQVGLWLRVLGEEARVSPDMATSFLAQWD